MIKTFELETGLGTILDRNKCTRPFVQKEANFIVGDIVTFDLNNRDDVSNVCLDKGLSVRR